MAWIFISGMLRITIVLVSVFIMLYAYMFLSKASAREEVLPWVYLFISSFIFTFYQVLALVDYFATPAQWPVNFSVVGTLLEFTFSGLILLSFVSQHFLILKSPLLLIARKGSENKD